MLTSLIISWSCNLAFLVLSHIPPISLCEWFRDSSISLQAPWLIPIPEQQLWEVPMIFLAWPYMPKLRLAYVGRKIFFLLFFQFFLKSFSWRAQIPDSTSFQQAWIRLNNPEEDQRNETKSDWFTGPSFYELRSCESRLSHQSFFFFQCRRLAICEGCSFFWDSLR